MRCWSRTLIKDLWLRGTLTSWSTTSCSACSALWKRSRRREDLHQGWPRRRRRRWAPSTTWAPLGTQSITQVLIRVRFFSHHNHKQALAGAGLRGKNISVLRRPLFATMEKVSRVPMSPRLWAPIFFSGVTLTAWAYRARARTCGTTWLTPSIRRSWCSTTKCSTASTTWARWQACSPPSRASPASRRPPDTTPRRGSAVVCPVTCPSLPPPGYRQSLCRWNRVLSLIENQTLILSGGVLTTCYDSWV